LVSSHLVPEPPKPFTPIVQTLTTGHALYRVHGNSRLGNEFNPGAGGRTRFAFFGVPAVPVLYAADTEAATVSESILHDVPIEGGQVTPHEYAGRVISRILVERELRLAQLHGPGLRALKVEASRLTGTDRSHYGRTVSWAERAHVHQNHTAPLDGMVWMSKRCNSDLAYVFFGDRVLASDFVVDGGYARAFDLTADLARLSDFCAPQHIDVVG
jgi:hypothetical protein